MTDPTRRVGLLGGTFDPIHLGHLVVAEHLLVQRGLDEVRLLVAGNPWMKDRTVTEASVRVELARLAVEDVEGIEVDDHEATRDAVGPGRATYTADTLADLSAREPGVAWEFCVGADAANDLHRWSRVEQVLALATVVVVDRPGSVLAPDAAVVDRLVHLPVPALDISSTALRRRYASGGATRFLVPPSVHHRILQLGLYRDGHG